MHQKCLVVIPARGGSKRIPGKNIRLFFGKPIIAYSITAALEADCFDEVMVSTDDPAITLVANNYGATVPFMRSESASNDHAGIAQVLEEVVSCYQEQKKMYSIICCILATAPFVTKEKLQQAYRIFLSSGADAAISVVRFSYPIQRALKIDNQKLSMFWPENYHLRSQDLEPALHDAGQFCFIKTEVLLREHRLLVDNMVPIILSDLEVQDIDTEEDWQLAELKYTIIKEKK